MKINFLSINLTHWKQIGLVTIKILQIMKVKKRLVSQKLTIKKIGWTQREKYITHLLKRQLLKPQPCEEALDRGRNLVTFKMCFGSERKNFCRSLSDSYDDISDREDQNEWYQAVEDEMNALEKNSTWTLTKLPPGKRAIDSKWVFKIKRDESRNVESTSCD